MIDRRCRYGVLAVIAAGCALTTLAQEPNPTALAQEPNPTANPGGNPPQV